MSSRMARSEIEWEFRSVNFIGTGRNFGGSVVGQVEAMNDDGVRRMIYA